MPSPLHCLHILKIRRCSYVLYPSHCQHWLFWQLCGHFGAFSSQLLRLSCYRPLLLHVADLGSRCLPRMRDASLLHSLLFAFALVATLLVLSLSLSLAFKLLVSRPTSLSVQTLSCSLAPSIARVAKPTFLTTISFPHPTLPSS
jgi:hypothetical protein